jgi:hypothetical protein
MDVGHLFTLPPAGCPRRTRLAESPRPRHKRTKHPRYATAPGHPGPATYHPVVRHADVVVRGNRPLEIRSRLQ